MRKITIAIDGFSSCGKSTLAKALAKELAYIYVDSGAMYRGVALYALRKDWVANDGAQIDQIVSHLTDIDISFELNPSSNLPELILNGENVESQIRTLDVSNVVSFVAPIKEVRHYLVDLQRKLGEQGGVVMDGRDIGSVVFPNAELKLFLTASPEIRAERRFNELKAKGDKVTLNEVKENLTLRDHLDSTREESPLIQTEDAVVIDNTELTPEGQLQVALELAEKAAR
jgi:cytidylate kinase